MLCIKSNIFHSRSTYFKLIYLVKKHADNYVIISCIIYVDCI